MTRLLDSIRIPTTYEELFDAKTRLKELCDKYRNELKITYTANQGDDNRHYVEIHLRGRVIGSGNEFVKVKAEQIAAKKAVANLARKGYKSHIPKKYIEFAESVTRSGRR